MEETTVLIVGGGPSGLALGALLGRMNVKTIILEKDLEVCEDPRGIVVNGDAVRISYQLGIGEGLTKRIGKDIGVLHFHRHNFRNAPYMNFDITVDWAQQSVSNNITQFQPNYEREIRALLKTLPSVELRVGCEVIDRQQEGELTVIEYLSSDGERHSVRTSWLVGADGKRGVVRKRFLEPEGIRQEESIYPYVGTWVAANLHITTPTPKSHPDFPLWRLGYTPEQVHDIFWPSGFHFCNSSKRPSVSGRFGPPGSGFWRHEFSVEPEDSLEDVEGDLWKQFGSWMVIPGSKFSRTLRNIAVEFPRDCIKVVRCRPFTFATKVVNRWYHGKTMLIGDAAHVFPPFGGQGIATGIRDAQALSWRLAVMSKPSLNVSPELREKILRGWSQERRHAWNAATAATKLNGSIVNMRSYWRGLFFRTCMRFLWWLPGVARFRTQRAFKDKLIYNSQTCPDGFFLEDAGGGRKIAQNWVRRRGEAPKLSDAAFLRDLTRLTIVVFVRKEQDGDLTVVEDALKAANMPEELLTMKDVTLYCIGSAAQSSFMKLGTQEEIYRSCSADELLKEGITPIKAYDQTSIEDRIGGSAKYILIRPDFFIHSVAANSRELRANLEKAKAYFS